MPQSSSEELSSLDFCLRSKVSECISDLRGTSGMTILLSFSNRP